MRSLLCALASLSLSLSLSPRLLLAALSAARRDTMVVSPTFRTEVPIEPRTHRRSSARRVAAAVGSCFSDGVGERLRAAGHDALSTHLARSSIRRPSGAVELFSAPDWRRRRRTVGYGSISTRAPRFRGPPPPTATTPWRARSPLAASSCSAAVCCASLGSAWARRPRERLGRRQLPQANARFERRLLGVDECADELRRCLAAARGVGGEGLRALVTVSPVRHWREAPSSRAAPRRTCCPRRTR